MNYQDKSYTLEEAQQIATVLSNTQMERVESYFKMFLFGKELLTFKLS